MGFYTRREQSEPQGFGGLTPRTEAQRRHDAHVAEALPALRLAFERDLQDLKARPATNAPTTPHVPSRPIPPEPRERPLPRSRVAEPEPPTATNRKLDTSIGLQRRVASW
jgi:hypothetical protein